MRLKKFWKRQFHSKFLNGVVMCNERCLQGEILSWIFLIFLWPHKCLCKVWRGMRSWYGSHIQSFKGVISFVSGRRSRRCWGCGIQGNNLKNWYVGQSSFCHVFDACISFKLHVHRQSDKTCKYAYIYYTACRKYMKIQECTLFSALTSWRDSMNPSLKRSADASKAAPIDAPRTIEYFDIIDALKPRPPPPVKPRGPLGS